MQTRLLVLWLASLVIGLVLVTAVARQGQDRRLERRVEQTVKAVAEDWLDAFQPTIDPDVPLDTMPALQDALSLLVRRRADIVDAGIFLRGGQRAAALPHQMIAPLELVDALFGVGGETSILRYRALPLAMTGEDGAHLLALPMRDWTGLTRGALVLHYEMKPAPSADPLLLRSPWPEIVIATLATLVLFVPSRRGGTLWRATRARWILPAALALVLGSCSFLVAARLVRQDIGGAAEALRALGGNLATPLSWWSPSAGRSISTPLDTRLLRMAQAVPEAVFSIEAPSHLRGAYSSAALSRDSLARPAFEFDLEPGQDRSDGVKRRLAITLDQGSWRQRTLWTNLRGMLVAVVVSLVLFQAIPLLTWARPRHSAGRLRISAAPLLFLIGCAATPGWPALVGTMGSLTSSRAGLAGFAALATHLFVAYTGLFVGTRLCRRHGWRAAAIPGLMLGSLGAVMAVLTCRTLAFVPVFILMGFAAGLAAAARTTFGPSRSSPWLQQLSGAAAGAAIGALTLQISDSVEATFAVDMALWFLALGVAACLPGDAGAALRYIVSRPGQVSVPAPTIAGDPGATPFIGITVRSLARLGQRR